MGSKWGEPGWPAPPPARECSWYPTNAYWSAKPAPELLAGLYFPCIEKWSYLTIIYTNKRFFAFWTLLWKSVIFNRCCPHTALWGFSHKTAKFQTTPFKPLSIGRLKGKIDFRIQQRYFYNQLNIYDMWNQKNSYFGQNSSMPANAWYIRHSVVIICQRSLAFLTLFIWAA